MTSRRPTRGGEDSRDSNTGNGVKKRGRCAPDATSSPACNQCRARKVRCDRQQPRCSNCRRADVECDFSASLKRVDRTKQLLNDFTSVVARLDRVDLSLARLSEQVQRQQCRCACGLSVHAEITPPDSASPPLTPGNDDTSNHQSSSAEYPSGELVAFEHGGQRLLGYPAAFLLFRNLRRQASQRLRDGVAETASGIWRVAACQPDIKDCLERQIEQFPFDGICREPVTTSDGRLITTPPRSLLELSVDCFLQNINIYTPIFTDASLAEAISMHYQSFTGPDSNAWAIVFTNIIILCLVQETRITRATASHLVSMNNDMLPSFLKNYGRALADLNQFMRPCETNVCALLTLALVARELFSTVLFERICEMACQLGRSVGLHRSAVGDGMQVSSWEKMPDRQRLFWVLYTMDKQRVFQTGQPCDLYLFDSDLRFPPCSREAPAVLQLNAAHVQLITIWEQIYIHLYSSRAARVGTAQRVRQVQRLRTSLNEWNLQHHELLSALWIEKVPDLAPLQLELKYCLMVSQVLVHRCGNDAWAPARTALRLISQVANDPNAFTPARYAVLARLFRNYPLVAFHDLFSICLAKDPQECAEDRQLIFETRQNLELLHHPEFPTAYYARLQVGLRWCTELLDTMKDCWTRSSMTNLSEWERGSGSSSSPTALPEPLCGGAPLEIRPEHFLPAGQWDFTTTLAMDTDESLQALAAPIPPEELFGAEFPVLDLTSPGGDGLLHSASMDVGNGWPCL